MLLRQLISQTAIYGLSSIVGRFLNYLLVPLYTYTFSTQSYGVVSEFYAYAGFFAVVLVLGLETGFFRFRQRPEYASDEVYANSLGLLILVNLAFFLLIVILQDKLSIWLSYQNHPEYIIWFAVILMLDAISSLPFAHLRAENQAWRFAGIKLTEIALTIFLNLFFLVICPKIQTIWPESGIAQLYDPKIGVGYIFLANLIASLVKMLLLAPQFRGVQLDLNHRLIKPIMRYSLPMVVIGFAGMVNEMLDRVLLKFLLPYDLSTNLSMLGIYGACYKLSILMTLFVQAFRYAGEPFFFSIANQQDAKQSYAVIMKYFVMFGVFIFLAVMLYIDLFKYFIGKEFRAGLSVVPVLLLANLLLGIYVNLSIWYKLTDRTILGAWVALAGALVTLILNLWWIPRWEYQGSAWATLLCYLFMVLVSWWLGRRYYPVYYPIGRMTAYLLLGLFLYGLQYWLTTSYSLNTWLISSLCLFSYLAVAYAADIKPLLAQSVKRSS